MSASKDINTGANKLSSDLQQRSRAFGVRVRTFVLSFLVAFALTSYLTFNRYAVDSFSYYLVANFWVHYKQQPNRPVSYKSPEGVKSVLTARQILAASPVTTGLEIFTSRLKLSSFISLLLAFGISYFFLHFLQRYGSVSTTGSKRIRGTELVPEEELISRMKKLGETSDLHIGNVPLVKNAETQQIFISGAIGCGKGNSIKGFLDTIAERKQRFLVYDKSGEYIRKYYREGKDVILNPFDERMPYWSPWFECENDFDYEMLAASFVPMAGETKRHWVDSPRTILADLMRRLAENGTPDIALLIKYAQNKNELHEFLEGTPSEQLLDPDSAEHASSVLSILMPKIKALRFLSDQNSEIAFSLREWVRDDDSDQRVFIVTNERQIETLKPLITAWIDIVVSEILSLPEDRGRRIFNIIDELASLDAINSLMTGVNEGRKFGLCNIFSVTSIEALKEIYGDRKTKSLAGMCSTKISYRNGEPEIATWLANLYGEEDVEDAKQSVTMSDRSDSTNIQDQRTKRHILLPTEFMDLPDKVAVVKLGRGLPVAKVDVPYVERPDIAEPMILKPTRAGKVSKPTRKQEEPTLPDIPYDDEPYSEYAPDYPGMGDASEPSTAPKKTYDDPII